MRDPSKSSREKKDYSRNHCKPLTHIAKTPWYKITGHQKLEQANRMQIGKKATLVHRISTSTQIHHKKKQKPFNQRETPTTNIDSMRASSSSSSNSKTSKCKRKTCHLFAPVTIGGAGYAAMQLRKDVVSFSWRLWNAGVEFGLSRNGEDGSRERQ